jgi:uncharacterized protein YjbI with pentapeptide repeats
MAIYKPPVKWETCDHDAACIGVAMGEGSCLAHAEEKHVDAALRQLRINGRIDARGVCFDHSLLNRLLANLPRDEERRYLGPAWFDQATFVEPVDLSGIVFVETVRFYYATFKRGASFHRSTFKTDAWFQGASFNRRTDFMAARFEKVARFEDSRFDKEVWFHRARFQDGTWFDGATFMDHLWLAEVAFETSRHFGPILVHKRLSLDDSVFKERIKIEVVTPDFSGRGVRFLGGVHLRVRWAELNLDDAEFAASSLLAGVQSVEAEFDEAAFAKTLLLTSTAKQQERPRLVLLHRADVIGLTISNVDLQACRFIGAHNLDRLRIEGEPLFARTHGWWRARRKTLAEEQHWRASRSGRWRPAGWYPEVCQTSTHPGAEQPAVLVPAQLAALYRELRKGREDARDEPGAADFYYGEMEMRRHNHAAPLAERLVLLLYWLVAGYGLRGLRALVSLAVVVIGLASLLQAIGFNGGDPPLRDAMIYAAQSTVSITITNKALTEHVSWAGEILRIILRLLGPLLLGLAILSVRNRVKR